MTTDRSGASRWCVKCLQSVRVYHNCGASDCPTQPEPSASADGPKREAGVLWIAKQKIYGYSNPTEPAKYPDWYTKFIEYDIHASRLAEAEARHVEFCEQAQEKTDADFKVLRERLEEAERQRDALRAQLAAVTEKYSALRKKESE